LLADAILSRLLVGHHAAKDPGAWHAEVHRETTRFFKIPLLEDRPADAELAKAWRLVAFIHAAVWEWEQAAAAQQRALKHARRAGTWVRITESPEGGWRRDQGGSAAESARSRIGPLGKPTSRSTIRRMPIMRPNKAAAV
jgi:hypothetical protein